MNEILYASYIGVGVSSRRCELRWTPRIVNNISHHQLNTHQSQSGVLSIPHSHSHSIPVIPQYNYIIFRLNEYL